MSDTPRTDEAFGPSVFGVRSRLCRTLERELAEARELITMKAQSLHAASAAIHASNQSMIEAMDALSKVREQRDRLADALREIASGLHDWKTCVDKIAPEAIAKLKP
jgi:chromosome segregation ATPase